MMYTDDALIDLLEEFAQRVLVPYTAVERDLQAVQAYLDTRAIRQSAKQAARRLFELCIEADDDMDDELTDDDDGYVDSV